MTFISLHDLETGKRILIDSSRVVAVYGKQKGTAIIIAVNSKEIEFLVEESAIDIAAKLESGDHTVIGM